MKIAFDVKGTIEGPRKIAILDMIRRFHVAGHDIIVWSNLYRYAVDAVKDNNLNAEATSKQMQSDLDYDESLYVDFAIEDDHSQTWLPAKRFVWVDDLPKDEEIPAFVENLIALGGHK